MALIHRLWLEAMLILKFRYTAALSLELELTGNCSANNAWMQTKFALHYQNLRANDARPGAEVQPNASEPGYWKNRSPCITRRLPLGVPHQIDGGIVCRAQKGKAAHAWFPWCRRTWRFGVGSITLHSAFCPWIVDVGERWVLFCQYSFQQPCNLVPAFLAKALCPTSSHSSQN